MRKLRFPSTPIVHRLVENKSALFSWLFPFFFLCFTLIFLMGDPFYEGGSYMAYMHSILTDGDFNIVNHLPEQLTRIVTSQFYHPDGHSEVQTPFLFIIYQLMSFFYWLSPVSLSSQTLSILTGFTVNFLALYLTHKVLLKISKIIKISYQGRDFAFFIFGTVAYYFTFNVVTVLEIFFLPIVTYALYLYLKNAKEHCSQLELLSFGLTLGLLLTSNASYKLLALGLILFIILQKKMGFQKKLLVIIPMSLYPCAHLINIYIKYGQILDVHQGANFLLEFSLGHFAHKLFYGYFLTDFLRSPLVLVSFLALLLILLALFRKKQQLTRAESGLLIVWSLFTVFCYLPFLGNLVEGHLSGRYFLRIAPLLILSLSYLRLRFSSFPLVILTVIGLFTTFCFIAFDTIDPLLYAERTFPTLAEWKLALSSYQYMVISNYQNYALVLVWAFPLSLLASFVIMRVSRHRQIVPALNIVLVLIFLIMTTFNYSFSDKKIARLHDASFFEGKVVGDGPHIYLIDYFFEKLANIEKSDPSLDMSLRVEKFYQIVETQVKSSTPEFDKAMQTRDKKWSFYLQYSFTPALRESEVGGGSKQ